MSNIRSRLYELFLPVGLIYVQLPSTIVSNVLACPPDVKVYNQTAFCCGSPAAVFSDPPVSFSLLPTDEPIHGLGAQLHGLRMQNKR